MASTQKNLSLTLKTPIGSDDLILQSFNGEEQMSGLFHYRLEMISYDNSLSFDKIVGENMTVTMNLADGGKEYFNGIVSTFKQLGGDIENTLYYAELVPKLWLLTLNKDSRIFQKKTVPDIIKAVLSEHGLSDVSDNFEQQHAEREYCVQYQESSFDFISRLMEDEGIYYFFKHEAGKHTLVLSDASSGFDDCQISDIRLKYSSDSSSEEDVLTSCSLEHVIGPSEYVLGDFDYIKPSAPLQASAKSKVKPDSKMKVFEFPGGYDTKDGGESKSTWRIEGKESARDFLRGSGYCRAFRPGFKFCLKNHDRKDMNKKYILKEVSHSMTQEEYSNNFAAFLDGKSLRPEKNTAIPIIPGAQTAMVVGPKGEEIYTDDLGRIKVQFHWDRTGENDEKSSCWIRVAQGVAGQGWGGFFLPRIKQEVVVSFLEGNPDRPLVTGAVYNGENKVPLNLPGEATRSTIKTSTSKGGKGSNEIRFEDLADSEELYFHAQKDMNLVVDNDCSSVILHDEKNTVKNDRSITVEEGNETLKVSSGNRSLTVGGDESLSVGGKRTVGVDGDETRSNKGKLTQKVSGDYLLDVSGDITIKAGGSLTIKAGSSMTIDAGQSLTNKAGMSISCEAGATVSIKGAMIKLN